MANHWVIKFLTSVFKHVCVIDKLNPNTYCDRCLTISAGFRKELCMIVFAAYRADVSQIYSEDSCAYACRKT